MTKPNSFSEFQPFATVLSSAQDITILSPEWNHRKDIKYREDLEDVRECYAFLPLKIKLHITVSNMWTLFFSFLMASLIRDFVAAQTSSSLRDLGLRFKREIYAAFCLCLEIKKELQTIAKQMPIISVFQTQPTCITLFAEFMLSAPSCSCYRTVIINNTHI